MRKRLHVAALIVLVFAIAIGAGIYFGAEEDDPVGANYVIVGGVVYPVDPATSKTYVRELQRFGGKASVLFDDFGRWFAARWRGRQLGLTIGVLGVGVALILAAIGRRFR